MIRVVHSFARVNIECGGASIKYWPSKEIVLLDHVLVIRAGGPSIPFRFIALR